MSTKLRIDFVTIFPRMIEPLLAEGVISRGAKQGILDIRVHDLRDFAVDKHRSTDDEAYGGGPGMVMLVEPVLKAMETINGGHVILPSPQGRMFTHAVAHDLAKELHFVFLCGRYEGFDERVHDIVKP